MRESSKLTAFGKVCLVLFLTAVAVPGVISKASGDPFGFARFFSTTAIFGVVLFISRGILDEWSSGKSIKASGLAILLIIFFLGVWIMI